MPGGKPAGVMCVNLDPESHLCGLWGTPGYPPVCRRFLAERAVCGESRAEALTLLTELESFSSGSE